MVRIRGGFRPMDGPGGFSGALRVNIPPPLSIAPGKLHKSRLF